MRSHLAVLHHERARNQPQRARQIVSQSQIERPQHTDGDAGLRLRRRRSGCGHYNRLAHPLRLQHHVALNVIQAAGVEARRLQLPEALGRDHQKEPPFDSGKKLEAAVGRGDGGGNHLSIAEQVYIRAGHFGARGIGHHAAD